MEVTAQMKTGADCSDVRQDQAKTQAKAVLQAEQRNRELKNKDKANDLKDQPLPRKENKSDTSLRS